MAVGYSIRDEVKTQQHHLGPSKPPDSIIEEPRPIHTHYSTLPKAPKSPSSHREI